MEGNETLVTLSPATVKSATGNGTGVLVQGYSEVKKRECVAILQCGAVSSGTTLDVKVQSSPDNSSWLDIAGAAFAQITTAADEKLLRFIPNNKYLREVHTISGTSYTFAVIMALTKTKDG